MQHYFKHLFLYYIHYLKLGYYVYAKFNRTQSRTTPPVLNYFGGKKKFLYWIIDYVKTTLGFYRRYRHINWSKVDRVLFVCKGNICRSAYAHALSANTNQFNNCEVDSFGVDTSSGEPANPTAIQVSGERGHSLVEHRTKTTEDMLLTDRDLIIYMEPLHNKILHQTMEQVPAQETYFALWSGRPAYLPDPYGTPIEVFERCFDLIESSLSEINKAATAAKMAGSK